MTIDESSVISNFRKEVCMTRPKIMRGPFECGSISTTSTAMSSIKESSASMPTCSERAVRHALKAEEMFSRVMYRQILCAHTKLLGAMFGDDDLHAATRNVEEILRNVLRLYLDVHGEPQRGVSK